MKRITVKNTGTDDWRGLIWSEECRYYQPDTPTAEPAYEAKDLTLKGGAEVKTVSGAEVVQHNALTGGKLAILGSEIDGVGHMTHLGPRRMWMRVEQLSGAVGDVKLQLLWRALGSSNWVDYNPIISPYVVDDYCLIDLGECRPQDATIGDQRWEWALRAWAPNGTRAIRIRDVYPLSTEQYLKCSEPSGEALADAQFTKSPGAAKSVGPYPIGDAKWANPSNALSSNNLYATATTSNDTGGGGLIPITTQQLWLEDFDFSLPEELELLGVLVEVECAREAGAGISYATARLLHGGAPVGGWRNYTGDLPESDTMIAFGGSSDLFDTSLSAAEASEADFGVAIFFSSNSKGAKVRIDDVRLTAYCTNVQTEDRVCFAGRSLELASDGVSRQAREDDVWGRTVPDGFLPVDNPGGPSRGIVIASQGDLGGRASDPYEKSTPLPDSGSNSLSVMVRTRAGHLYARADGS